MAIGLEWSSRIIAIGLEMAIPIAGGYWLDQRCGTLPLFICLGALLGVAIAIWQFVRIARDLARKNN